MKVLAVCGSGMGTSMIMKLKVSQLLQKLGIQADSKELEAKLREKGIVK